MHVMQVSNNIYDVYKQQIKPVLQSIYRSLRNCYANKMVNYNFYNVYNVHQNINKIVCGVSRAFCDDQFGKCLKKKCGNDQECKQKADMMKLGTNIFGCQSFLDGQKDLCKCLSLDNEIYNNNVKESIINYYNKLSLIDESYGKTNDEIEILIEKYKGKEDKLVFGLLNKYHNHLIEQVEMNTQGKFEL